MHRPSAASPWNQVHMCEPAVAPWSLMHRIFHVRCDGSQPLQSLTSREPHSVRGIFSQPLEIDGRHSPMLLAVSFQPLQPLSIAHLSSNPPST